MQVTENVIEFMADKISHFPKNTQEILKICACIGNRFDLELLSVVSGKSIEETLSDLTSAIQEDMISLHGSMYKFLHDRIQEAAYSMIPEAEKEAMHYRIGSNVLKKPETEIFMTKYFILSISSTGESSLSAERMRNLCWPGLICRLRRNRKNLRHTPLLHLFKNGDGAFARIFLESHYDLTYAIYREAIECEYLKFEFQRGRKNI